MKITSNDVLKEVASEVADQSNKIETIAQEEKSPTDEAFEHARAYWWMGWSWEEIDAILEDMDYTDSVIKSAISRAQEYAKKVLNDGPFSMYKEGQLAKMENGYIGQVSNIYPEHIELEDLNDRSVVAASEKEMDFNSSLKLKEAYLLRLASYKIIKAAPEDEKAIQKIVPQKPVMPGPPEQGMQVDPNELEQVDVKIQQKAPQNWGDLTPQMSEVEEVNDVVAGALAQVDAAEEELGVLKSELKELNAMAKEFRSRQKELKKKEAEIAKQLFSVVGSENAALEDLETTVFYKYKNKLVGLQRRIDEMPREPGPVDELRALKETISANFPEISNTVFDIIDTWKRENTVIDEKIVETFAMYSPPKKKSGQLMEKLTGWMGNVWESVKSSINTMYYTLFPAVDATVEAIDDFLATSEDQERAASIEEALKVKGLI